MENITAEQLAVVGRRAYYKQWREKNKEKLKEYRKNYFAQKATAIAAEQSNGGNNDEHNDNE